MDLPVIVLAPYLSVGGDGSKVTSELGELCREVSRILREMGACAACEGSEMYGGGQRPVVAEMAAIGFGLPKDTFTSIMKQAPHYLAPTGSDLRRYGQEGSVSAGYHYDLNFLTIHGRSSFPGLNIWLNNGQKVEVEVPSGYLLLQTGKQVRVMLPTKA
ncbi:hypothetical protein EZV62_017633 [Acer yangbiense]|uniref:Isopenicillin N synthase-like Fe(2+) 2OG dioxygenase domain-containing protein n=1 Tax=Acer yangbiense TaxID=1000413 RepID=A0A5C7HGZ5_9ROSI|nr:hypothetical protein EZV62_017633 [Acer yangbiense]